MLLRKAQFHTVTLTVPLSPFWKIEGVLFENGLFEKLCVLLEG